MELEVVWSGASWRDIPPPVDLVLRPSVTQTERRPAGDYQDILWSILTDAWAESKAIAYHAVLQGMERKRVRDYLSRMVAAGRVERQIVVRPATVDDQTRTMHLFRRRQA